MPSVAAIFDYSHDYSRGGCAGAGQRGGNSRGSGQEIVTRHWDAGAHVLEQRRGWWGWRWWLSRSLVLHSPLRIRLSKNPMHRTSPLRIKLVPPNQLSRFKWPAGALGSCSSSLYAWHSSSFDSRTSCISKLLCIPQDALVCALSIKSAAEGCVWGS
jgi:hypothetical protein